jgi:hypothetical protein
MNYQLPITKSFQGADKDQNGNIIALNYRLTYSYTPPLDKKNTYLTEIRVRDRMFNNDKTLLAKPLDWSNFNFKGTTPCDPKAAPEDPASASERELIWDTNTCLPGMPAYNTFTIALKLVFNKSWQETYPNAERICNQLVVEGKTSEGEQLTPSSLPEMCVTKEGKIYREWDIVWPIDSEAISDCFNKPRGPIYHKGIDIKTGSMNPPERPVRAIDDGEIVFSSGSEDNTYGYFVHVKHKNGWISRYAHLDPSSMPKLGPVKKGEIIGLSDNTGESTGPHLHFEILKGGLCNNNTELDACWVDPLCFYPDQWINSRCPVPNQCKL